MRSHIKFILPLIILLFTSDLIGQTIVENGLIRVEGNLAYYKGELFNGKRVSYYGNRQLKREQNYKKGKKDGLGKRWYENGQLKEELNYKDGKMDGLVKRWYENGQLSSESNWKKGESDGLSKGWYKNGQLHWEQNHKKGKKEEKYKKWYENGQLEYEGNYKDGKAEGLFKGWYDNGALESEKNYKDGKENGLFKEWYENGQLKEERNYKEGIYDGVRCFYSEEGKLTKKETYQEGKLTKKDTYKEGELINTETFSDYVPKNGIKKEYYKGGYSKVYYEDDIKINETKFNSSNKVIGYFEFDKKTGDTITKCYYDNYSNSTYKWWTKDSIEVEKFYFTKASTYSSFSEKSRYRVLGLNKTQYGGELIVRTYLNRKDFRFLIQKRDEKDKLVISQSGCKTSTGEWCDCPKDIIEDPNLKRYFPDIPKVEIPVGGVFTDNRDGKEYKTVKIGEQVWMAENLAFKTESGNYWAYNNDTNNISICGFLYDWETAKELCPAGWHLPSYNEWSVLTDYLGGIQVAGTKMKSTSGWLGGGNGTNDSGFNAFPGGMRAEVGGIVQLAEYNGYGNHANWWSSSESNTDDNFSLKLYKYDGSLSSYTSNKTSGFSVRCIKD